MEIYSCLNHGSTNNEYLVFKLIKSNHDDVDNIAIHFSRDGENRKCKNYKKNYHEEASTLRIIKETLLKKKVERRNVSLWHIIYLVHVAHFYPFLEQNQAEKSRQIFLVKCYLNFIWRACAAKLFKKSQSVFQSKLIINMFLSITR